METEVIYLTSRPAWGWKLGLYHWRHVSVDKLLKTHSCPNSICHCLSWPWSTMSTAFPYIKLRPDPDQQPGPLLVSFTTNQKHWLLPYSVLSLLRVVLVLDYLIWTWMGALHILFQTKPKLTTPIFGNSPKRKKYFYSVRCLITFCASFISIFYLILKSYFKELTLKFCL